MISSIEKMSGRPPRVSCLSGFSLIPASVPGGVVPHSASFLSGLVGAVETGIRAVVSGGSGGESDTARVAAAAQTHCYALAANGAGLARAWAGGRFVAGGIAAVATQQHRMMRAFRGLEPWREPS
jgi:hypothetical protein